MGMCASSPKEEVSSRDTPREIKGSSSNHNAAGPSINSTVAIPKPNINRPSSQQLSPIDKAIASARKELEKHNGTNFESVYTCSKLIGHGAFAKVSICEHNQTKALYAAKVVTKNQDDPEKQREGEKVKRMGVGKVAGYRTGTSILLKRSAAHHDRPLTALV